MRGITVSFPGVLANDRVDFSLQPGEVHVLLGENGAGKTTLMNVLYGLVAPDQGEILVQGQRVRLNSTQDAIRHGIGMVHQHFMLIPSFTVVENVVLGLPSEREPFLFLQQQAKRIADCAKTYGITVDPWARVAHLSVGEQQKVEILKALYRRARVLIFDEPTAVLVPQEIDSLLATLRTLARQGLSVILITHKLEEVMAVGDRVTVMRQGRVAAVTAPQQTTKEELAACMVGRPVSFHVSKQVAQPGARVLHMEGVSAKDDQGITALDNISLSVHEGQVLGIAGVDGNGQRELVEVIMNLRRPTAGRITVDGSDITHQSPRRVLQRGVAYVPADRRRQGLILEFSVQENLVLQAIYHPPLSGHGFIHAASVAEYARRLAAQYDVRPPRVEMLARQLSGGNQQKVVLARELSRSPRLVVAVQPTRGLDVGATEYVHRRFLDERSRGAAIVLVSTELDEVLDLSDCIAVMFRGRMMGVVKREDADVETLGLMMAGTALEAIPQLPGKRTSRDDCGGVA